MPTGLEVLFERRTLTRAVNSPTISNATPSFFWRTFFGRSRNHFSEYIDFEVRRGNRGMAKFRHRGQEANVVGKTGTEIRTFKMPNMREKKVLTAVELLREGTLGQIYTATGGGIEAARNAALARELQDLKNRVIRRREWWAAQTLAAGLVRYEDESIAFEIDYAIPSQFKPVLSGTDLWTDPASNISDHLFEWQSVMNAETGGNLDRVILGTSAAGAFRNNAGVKKDLDTNNYAAGRLEPNVASAFLGRYNNVDFFHVAETMQADDGSTVSLMPANMAIAVSTAFDGETFYGVVDEVDRVFAGEFFSKSWVTEDPSERWLLVASRPFPVAYAPGSWMMATVTTA